MIGSDQVIRIDQDRRCVCCISVPPADPLATLHSSLAQLDNRSWDSQSELGRGYAGSGQCRATCSAGDRIRWDATL